MYSIFRAQEYFKYHNNKVAWNKYDYDFSWVSILIYVQFKDPRYFEKSSKKPVNY